ncbi:MAG: radical SAM family heme chaperone HemW [Chloroflexota bacterium]|nr:radical SAM family heme chaperone HemW [Chloroflexota bacterium]
MTTEGGRLPAAADPALIPGPVPEARPAHSLADLRQTGISLYVHVPFCQTKCPYCDFNTYQGIEGLMSPFLDALLAETSTWARALDHPPVNTVFFGGGTPSYLPDGFLGRIMETIGQGFPVRPDAEITIEANPGDLMIPDKAASLLEQGINRVSIGVQSLDNDLLNLLGRRHDADQAIAAFRTVGEAGFDNVNLDLIYGLPRQSLAQWQDTLCRLAALEPAHISLYCLTVEEGTPLHRWVERGEVPLPDSDLAADMYQFAREHLREQGYHHYEISNWSRPGLASRHNLAYWRNLPYLGVGPGAHSCLGGYRFWDMDPPRAYIEAAQKWAAAMPECLDAVTSAWLESVGPVGGHEPIDLDLAAAETMFLGLRLLDGLDLAEASSRLGMDLGARYRAQIVQLLEQDLLVRDGDLLRLHPSAFLIANQVFTRFLD